ncbi:MAG TPA: hypothetical protein DHW40_12350, partial [Microbacterium sp.]|nr:hypothetical protein [Microbacterium sp.]
MRRADGPRIVLHSSNEMYGADRMVLEVLRALEEPRNVTVLLPDDVISGPTQFTDELEALGVHARIVPLPVLRRAYLTPRGAIALIERSFNLFRLFGRIRPSTVWIANSSLLICAPIARLSGAPLVILHLQEMWSGVERVVLSFLALFCGRIIAISSAVADRVLYRTRRVSVVHNAVPAPTSVTRVDTSANIFLVASRWNDWKGHRTLLAAWKLAGEPGSLLIAGGPPPIGRGVNVPALIDEMKLSRSVSVVGEVADLGDLYMRASWVVVPSDAPEPFGLVAIEAMARMRP